MKTVFLNFQNIETDIFNLSKSLRKTSKGVYVFAQKRPPSKLHFQKKIAYSI